MSKQLWQGLLARTQRCPSAIVLCHRSLYQLDILQQLQQFRWQTFLGKGSTRSLKLKLHKLKQQTATLNLLVQRTGFLWYSALQHWTSALFSHGSRGPGSWEIGHSFGPPAGIPCVCRLRSGALGYPKNGMLNQEWPTTSWFPSQNAPWSRSIHHLRRPPSPG